jgi:integrase
MLGRFVDGRRFGSLHVNEIGSRSVRHVVRELVTEGKISPKTIRNVVGILHTCFRSAVAEELCIANPVVLDPSDMPRVSKREMPVYSETEANAIINAEYLDDTTRMLFTLMLFTGTRLGEACGFLWGDIDASAAPLKALWLGKQYDGQPLKGDTDKERPRWIPVAVGLDMALESWRVRWTELYGREPGQADPIVPHPESGQELGPAGLVRLQVFTRNAVYKRARRRFEWLGLSWKGNHACRRTFISLCRRGHPRKDILERITHNASGDTVDRYTRWEWEPLCGVVQALPLAFRNGIPWRSIRGPEDVASRKQDALTVEARGIEPRSDSRDLPELRQKLATSPSDEASVLPKDMPRGIARGVVRESSLDAWALALAAESVGLRRAS